MVNTFMESDGAASVSWQFFQAWHTRWEGLPFCPGLSYSEAPQSILYNLANAISWQITTGSQSVKGFPFAIIYFHYSYMFEQCNSSFF